jgi:hypothetical protein
LNMYYLVLCSPSNLAYPKKGESIRSHVSTVPNTGVLPSRPSTLRRKTRFPESSQLGWHRPQEPITHGYKQAAVAIASSPVRAGPYFKSDRRAHPGATEPVPTISFAAGRASVVSKIRTRSAGKLKNKTRFWWYHICIEMNRRISPFCYFVPSRTVVT